MDSGNRAGCLSSRCSSDVPALYTVRYYPIFGWCGYLALPMNQELLRLVFAIATLVFGAAAVYLVFELRSRRRRELLDDRRLRLEENAHELQVRKESLLNAQLELEVHKAELDLDKSLQVGKAEEATYGFFAVSGG